MDDYFPVPGFENPIVTYDQERGASFVLHCGYCGHPMRDCGGGCAVQVAPPVVPPAPSRFVQRGGYRVCTVCQIAEEWCGCAKQPPPPPTQGDGDASDLNRRVKDCQGR